MQYLESITATYLAMCSGFFVCAGEKKAQLINYEIKTQELGATLVVVYFRMLVMDDE